MVSFSFFMLTLRQGNFMHADTLKPILEISEEIFSEEINTKLTKYDNSEC